MRENTFSKKSITSVFYCFKRSKNAVDFNFMRPGLFYCHDEG